MRHAQIGLDVAGSDSCLMTLHSRFSELQLHGGVPVKEEFMLRNLPVLSRLRDYWTVLTIVTVISITARVVWQ